MRERFHAHAESEQLARIRLLAPQLGKKLKRFLEGIPQRYMSIHSAEEIAAHIEMASRISNNGVQLKLNRQGQLFLLTVAMQDRPMIFCTIAGALVAWGMNIVKADAFANGAGMVLDTFYFADTFRTLELNMEEWTRFQDSISDVLTGKTSLETLMKDAGAPRRRARAPPSKPVCSSTTNPPAAALYSKWSPPTVLDCSTK